MTQKKYQLGNQNMGFMGQIGPNMGQNMGFIGFKGFMDFMGRVDTLHRVNLASKISRKKSDQIFSK